MRLPKLCELLHSDVGDTWVNRRAPLLLALGCQLALVGLILWGAL